MADLPSGTVTFLFTDLEGSTRLWEEYPDAMHDALARHDELVRSAIELNRAARIMSAGHGGQVLVSHASEELVRDAMSSEEILLLIRQTADKALTD